MPKDNKFCPIAGQKTEKAKKKNMLNINVLIYT